MTAQRGNDNFTNPHEYILNQLFKYNYHSDRAILKMKIWVLDGDIANRDGLQDNSYYFPLNHFRWLMNELTFLDRYIRTQDDELEENEDDFYTLKDKRIRDLERWIARINPETGLPYEDWQMPYHKRPTSLEDDQFEELAQACTFKLATWQISNAFDIVNKITSYCIDIERCDIERTMDQYEDPETTEDKLKASAETMQDDQDRLYVDEMERIREEILSYLPLLFDPDELEELEIEEDDLCMLGFCQQRVQVGLEPEDSSHKGIITSGGGYRYCPLKFDGTAWPESGIEIEGDDISGNEEKTFNGFQVGTLTELEGVYNFALLKTQDDWDTETQERFEEINSRWVTLNNLREYRIQNMGTRAIIESMVNATVPDLSGDHFSHYLNKSYQKTDMLNILSEICPEFIVQSD